MAHRFTGGAAALRIANMNTKAAVFFFERPIAPTTVATIAPRTKMEMLPRAGESAGDGHERAHEGQQDPFVLEAADPACG